MVGIRFFLTLQKKMLTFLGDSLFQLVASPEEHKVLLSITEVIDFTENDLASSKRNSQESAVLT